MALVKFSPRKLRPRPGRRKTFEDRAQRVADAAIRVVEELREYWPLTLRQIYYRLVANETIENDQAEYKHLSGVLVDCRLWGLVPWESMEDRSRVMLDNQGWADADHFMAQEVDDHLAGYRRELMASQAIALEIWCEKDALAALINQVARGYCVPVIVARGFSSMSFKDQCRRRIEARYRDYEEPTRILDFGDLDPSGWEMLPAVLRTLRREFDLGAAVDGTRCALTPDQVHEHNLLHNPKALKWGDSRARKYVEQFGEMAVELDALHPETLQKIVRQSIEDNLDLNLLKEDREQEIKDRRHLEDKRSAFLRWMAEQA